MELNKQPYPSDQIICQDGKREETIWDAAGSNINISQERKEEKHEYFNCPEKHTKKKYLR